MDTRTLSRRRDLKQATAVWVVVASGVVAAVQVGKVAIAVPMLQAALGLDLVQVGWVAGVFAVVGLFGGIPAGALVAGWGDRRILIVGLAAIALGAVLGARASSFAVLVSSRLVEGFGFLLITVAGPAVLQRMVAAEQRDGALALWSCFMPAGMAAAMLATPLFECWRAIWWASAFLAGATVACVIALVPRAAPTSRSWTGLGTDAVRVLQAPGPLLLAGCFTLYSLMFFALFNFLPVLLMERMQVSHATAGLLSAAATGVNMIGNLLAASLLARGTSRPVLIAGASLIMGVCALGVFLPVLPAALGFALAVLFSAVGGLIPATLLSSAPMFAPAAQLAPIVVGLVMQGSNLGQAVGPVMVGGAVEAYGWPASAGVVLISAGFTAALAGALAKAGARETPVAQ
jgi:predicted MFS family arabinose efflux permease